MLSLCGSKFIPPRIAPFFYSFKYREGNILSANIVSPLKEQRNLSVLSIHLNALMSHDDRKCTFGHVRPKMIQISLRIRVV